jgi:hypothetical protein
MIRQFAAVEHQFTAEAKFLTIRLREQEPVAPRDLPPVAAGSR